MARREDGRSARNAAGMTQPARPTTLEDLKRLLAALDREHAEYLLIGGYALLAHGYPRAAVDIEDGLISPRYARYLAAAAALLVASFRRAA